MVICALLCRFGERNGNIFYIGTAGEQFLAVGTFMGYVIIVTCILLTYLFGGTISILEFFINLVGAILFAICGVITLSNHRELVVGMILGILSIIAAVIFLIDFIVAIKNTRFVTTTR